MSIDEFVVHFESIRDEYEWEIKPLSNIKLLRTKDDLCPVTVVGELFGLQEKSVNAIPCAMKMGISKDDAHRIIEAADGVYTYDELRNRLLPEKFAYLRKTKE